MPVNNEFTIDIGEIISRRLGGRRLPSFMVKWLRDFIHEDFLNEYLQQGRMGVDFCTGTVEYLNVDLDVKGLENLPLDDGRCYTFVSNHPLGAIDGVTLGSIIGQHYHGRIKYLVNDLLMNLKGLAPLCVPVNKLGGQSRGFPAQVEAVFNSTDHVIMFPAGLCSRLIDGKVHDLPWKKTFITKSIQTQRDIIPVHFIAENSPRFYRIALWCKRLGLKFNLAMAFLPDEMYRSRGKRFEVRFGKPIPYQTFDKTRSHAQWALWVEDEVYKI